MMRWERSEDGQWIGPLVRKEIERMNNETKAHFDKTVQTIEQLEMDTALRRLISDVWGTRAFVIPEPSSLSEGRR